MDDDYFSIRQEAGAAGADGSRAVLVTLAGEFDLGASGDLRDVLLHLVDDAGTASIVVDLAAVTFIDSEAVGALLDGYLAAQNARIGLRAINAQGLVKRVLDVLGMLTQFDPTAGPGD